MGAFLPDDDPEAARAFAVLGSKLHRELFGDANPLGEIVRIGSERWRVVGVMAPKGQFVGIDLDDAVYIPASRGLDMFDREGLMEVDVLFAAGVPTDSVCESIRAMLVARHGREDFTVTTQQQMLDVLDSVLGVLTFAVVALGSISLVVGGVGILTIMTIALQERRSEIGLLLALGATRRQLLVLFLAEAAVLSALGGLLGLVLGIGGARLLQLLVPGLPVATTWFHSVLAESVAVAIGLAAGIAPALRAAREDPIEALRAE
jgi:putative ABC transport system permease protein